MTGAAGEHPREALSPYLDDELGVEDRSTVDRHLALCEDCRIELEALRRIARAVAEEPAPPVPDDLAARIGRRLDGGETRRPFLFRFAIPATVVATLSAIGVFVALQWREGRLVPPAPTETAREARAADAARPMDEPVPQQAPASAAPPVAAPQPQPGVVPGPVAGIVGSVEKDASVAAATGSATAPPEERKERTLAEPSSELSVQRSESVIPTKVAPSTAAPQLARVALSVCGDRWSDSGARGVWKVPNAVAAVLALDRMAHDVGGAGIWWGVADGRPYVMIVPRGRFEEVFFSLRARGVTGLDELPALTAGNGCAGISIALEVGATPSAPPK